MAAGSLLTLLDDIATLLDDVSLMTKVAAKKTAGVLGDDLALNAQQVTGVRASRELPIVWAVAKGSLRNKLILVPAALLISVIAPWLITPLLMLGGAFLCYEGAEKLAHKFLHGGAEASKEDVRAAAKLKSKEERLAFEKDKIKGAVRTDFILSAEIIAITLGSVASASFTQQVVVLAIIAVAITAAVYGLVAGIVKLDDLGVYLTERSASFAQSIGRGILWAAPYLMKLLSIVGTIAMFLVGGSILTHGVPFIHHAIENLAEAPADIPGVGAIIQPLAPMLLNFACGLLAGAVVLGAVQLIKKLRSGSGH